MSICCMTCAIIIACLTEVRPSVTWNPLFSKCGKKFLTSTPVHGMVKKMWTKLWGLNSNQDINLSAVICVCDWKMLCNKFWKFDLYMYRYLKAKDDAKKNDANDAAGYDELFQCRCGVQNPATRMVHCAMHNWFPFSSLGGLCEYTWNGRGLKMVPIYFNLCHPECCQNWQHSEQKLSLLMLNKVTCHRWCGDSWLQNDLSVDVFIVRDSDCRLSDRDYPWCPNGWKLILLFTV